MMMAGTAALCIKVVQLKCVSGNAEGRPFKLLFHWHDYCIHSPRKKGSSPTAPRIVSCLPLHMLSASVQAFFHILCLLLCVMLLTEVSLISHNLYQSTLNACNRQHCCRWCVEVVALRTSNWCVLFNQVICH